MNSKAAGLIGAFIWGQQSICLGAELKVNLQNFHNSLAKEKSPYLLQHASNPVHWMPWGDEAFEKARAEDKPVFLSIGYSTCHWCHVMAHESFESEAVAQILNRDFVCIKVDREERPDIDRIYMGFVQATTGSGGWPMSVWLTPERAPFYGGTYFPPADRYGRPGFPTLLERIAFAWKNDRNRILETAQETLQALRSNAKSTPGEGPLDSAPMDRAFEGFLHSYDEDEGGFGSAPKFPRPATLHFLLRYARRSGTHTRSGQLAAEMALHTLRKMSRGGMNDQAGGGFHRYSVDRLWHVPHYEKMLYDQAQIVCAALEAHQLTGDAECAQTAAATLDYVLNEMTDPAGGFHSAEDADSLFEHGSTAHGEGAFYVWTQSEIDLLLGADAPLFCAVYGILPGGNSPAGSDPHGELAGKNTLIRKLSPAEAARKSGLSEPETEALLKRCRAKLYQARSARPKPHRDDKILTAWNGLMISALARGGAILDNPRYVEAAGRAAAFIQKHLWQNGVLLRSYRQGAGSVEGFAEDYAFAIQGLLDLYESTFEPAHLRWAKELQDTMDRLFWDSAAGGYFSSAEGDRGVIVRMKEDNDGAEPSASAVAANNLRRLAFMTGNSALREQAEQTVRAFHEILKPMPQMLPQMLCSLDGLLEPAQQIVLAGETQSPEMRELIRAARASFQPNLVWLHTSAAAGAPGWMTADQAEQLSSMKPLERKPAAYVCKNFVCLEPTASPQKLTEILKAP